MVDDCVWIQTAWFAKVLYNVLNDNKPNKQTNKTVVVTVRVQNILSGLFCAVLINFR